MLHHLVGGGLIKISGEDRLHYLHNQSTNNIKSLSPGQGGETVLVNSTARMIDLARAYVTADAILLVVSPNRREFLMSWFDRFIFPFDKVELEDLSDSYDIYHLIGSECFRTLQGWGITPIQTPSIYDHQEAILDGIPIRISKGSSLSMAGYQLIVPKGKSIGKDIEKINEHQWEQLRILDGRPKPDNEITEDYNPLEAGLWHAISLDKGCYIGQETITRLNTYKGVSKRLWGINLENPTTAGSIITVEDERVGKLTSYTDTPNGPFGLGYVRTKAGGEGLKVQIGDTVGELVPVPYIRHLQ